MKYCPTCKSSYTDDQLLYCLTDGTQLTSQRAYDSEPTLFVGAPPPLPPAMNPPSPVVTKEPADGGKKGQTLAMTLMLAAGLIIGLLIAYILLRPAATAPMQSDLTANTSNVNFAPVNTTQPKARETPAKQPVMKPSPVSNGNTASTRDARWFVVLGTFESTDSAGANVRLERVKAEGFTTAYVVDTNKYPNFTPNKLAVVLGPYTEGEAGRIGGQVRSLKPTIKPGW